MNTAKKNRRNFLKTAGAVALGSTLPISLVELAFANTLKTLRLRLFPIPIFNLLKARALYEIGTED